MSPPTRRSSGSQGPEPIVVRPAADSDLGAVLAIHAANAAKTSSGQTDVERSTWRTMQSTPGLTVLLATLDERAVGTATLTLLPNVTYACSPSAIVEAVVVVPEARRLGVATALMMRCLEEAGAAGADKIQLLSHKRHGSDGAHDLYRKLGFTPEAEGFRLYLRTPQVDRAATSDPKP